MGTTETAKAFIEDKEIPWEELGNGLRRKIMSYDDNVMMVKVEFQKGAIGTLHQHYHTQITHIEKGVFEVEVSGQKKILSAGDGFHIPPNALHGVVCMEAGILIDIFNPMREDFVNNGKG